MLLFGVDGTLPLAPFTPRSDGVKRGRIVLGLPVLGLVVLVEPGHSYFEVTVCVFLLVFVVFFVFFVLR